MPRGKKTPPEVIYKIMTLAEIPNRNPAPIRWGIRGNVIFWEVM